MLAFSEMSMASERSQNPRSAIPIERFAARQIASSDYPRRARIGALARQRTWDSLSRLPQGWDSYGGTPLLHATRLRVDRFLGFIQHRDLPDPEIAIGSSGDVNVEWRFNGRELEVGIRHVGELEFVKVDERGAVSEGRFNDDVPEEWTPLFDWLSHG
jgi:hypothetical protein